MGLLNASSKMVPGRWLVGAFALACTACAGTPVTPQAELGYRLVVENGTASISGQVSAPKTFFATSAGMFERDDQGELQLAETAVAGATVRALDATGQLNGRVLPVQTDERGRFTIRGLRLGESAFLQAQFKGANAEERSLYAYVKPERAQVCATINLASTLVVHKMLRSGQAAAAFSAEKLAEVIKATEAKLPELLIDAAELAGGNLDQVVGQVLQQATTTGPGGGGLSGSVGSTIDRLFDQDPVIRDGMNNAIDTYLDVNFTVQAMGVNMAPVVHSERIRQLLIGKVELVCQAGAQPYTSVSFWLNNQAVAEAQFDGQAWVAALDSQGFADGPYVLSAVAKRKDADTPAVMRAFVYVRNVAPAPESACEGWEEGTP